MSTKLWRYGMIEFKALAPGVEVNSAAVLSVVEGMGVFRRMALKILTAHGIVSLDKGIWYSQQAWLDSFKEIADRTGAATLRNIGKKIPETALWPSEVDSIETALASIDVAYHMNHRGGEIGHYTFELIRPGSGQMFCSNPYPCPFDLGIIEATAWRFAPENIHPFVKHDLSLPCRRKGSSSCTYLISW